VKSLLTLIKLQKTYVDEQRRLLAALQGQLERIESSITELQIELAREQVAAEQSEESRTTYGAFLTAALARGKALEAERQKMIQEIELARQKLAELFEEQKRYEIALENYRKAEAAEAARRDRITLDEVGSVQHGRKD
jgi:hypothetical protein